MAHEIPNSVGVEAPIVGRSAAMQPVLAAAQLVAQTTATVLVLGETGVGKGVLAQAIHDASPRRRRAMVSVSCAAIPIPLLEGELFGRERGAYTGAVSRTIGRFEAAEGSTIFLDEIGDVPLDMQVKLLRVLEDRTFERLGSSTSVKVDIRVIAATNRSLEDAVREKTFREDLFYRLNVFPIIVPPLRERAEDIPELVWGFVSALSRSFGKRIESIPERCMRALKGYTWPGNVRELRNVVERALIVASGPELVVWPPRADRAVSRAPMTLAALQFHHIHGVLERTDWRVRGAGGAAERLGLKPTTLESLMARLGIRRPNPAGLEIAGGA